MRHISELIPEYYAFEFSGEPYEGTHFELDPKECQAMFQLEGRGDEYKFRERLEKMDNWFEGKSYKVQKDALNYVAKWLRDE